MEWLEKGLKTDLKKGISKATIDSRIQAFGSNQKDKVKPKNLCQLMWEAFEDLVLRILFVAGIVTIAINVWAEEDHRSTAWIEGFAILIAVFLVVIVTAYNDLKKEQEFQKLNDEAESGKKVSVMRDGVENDELHIGAILTGDLVILKSGNEIPGDGILI